MKKTNRHQVLNLFADHLKSRVGATAVYFGILRDHETPNDEVEDDSKEIIYESSTNPDQLRRVFTKGMGGLTWDLVDEDQADDDQDVETEDLKFVHVPNLLSGPHKDKVHFFERPLCGAFFAAAFSFPSYLHDEALKAALAENWPNNEKENEEEVEDVPEPPSQNVRMVMYMDKTGTSLDFEEHLEWIKNEVLHIKQTLTIVDKVEYLKHR